MVYEKIDKHMVADARFLPSCACPLSLACRSLATTVACMARQAARAPMHEIECVERLVLDPLMRELLSS